MIRIVKPQLAPKALTTKGATQTKKDCADYDSCIGDYRSGKAKFEKHRYYNAKPVKALMLKSHYNKCCYCEKKYRSPRLLSIEHFRPKSGVRQARNQKEEFPGYYWLAYDWDNLLLSCHDCNSDHKQTLFPLANPKKRARSHHDDVSRERPLFINPAVQDPRDHIRFDIDAIKPITPIGQATIEGLGLRRTALKEERLEKIDWLQSQLVIVKLAKQHPKARELRIAAKKAKERLNDAVLPNAEFSSMAQDFLNGIVI